MQTQKTKRPRFELKPNQRVKISTPDGYVIGRIEEVQPGHQWGATRVATISYYSSVNRQYLLTALEMGGEWWDLARNPLDLEVVGQFGCGV